MERFVVSTGRAGSTLLSKLLAQNQTVLSLSEFLGAVDNLNRFPADPVDGETFAAMLSKPDDIGVLMRSRGFRIKESTYSHGVDGHRWGVLDVPALLAAPLPAITDDPDGLFDAIMEFAGRQPERPVGDQYRALFAWLCERLDKAVWVERAGASLRYFGDLRATFPEARFVHIHRDGLETALSMREHNWFVLAAHFHRAAPHDSFLDRVADADGDDDPVRDLYVNKPPVERFGDFWTYMILKGFEGFSRLRPEQLLDVRYENLLADPRHELTRIARFLELPEDPGWVERAVAQVHGDGERRADRLGDAERARLERACQPGQVVLGRSDPSQLTDAYAAIRANFRRTAV